MLKQKQKFPRQQLKLAVALMVATFLFGSSSPILAENITISANNDAQVTDLKQQAETKRLEIEKIQNKLDVYQKSVEIKRQEQITLKNELDILSEQIDQLQLEIEKNSLEIDATNLLIQSVLLQILDKEDLIQHQTDQLGELIRVMNANDGKSYLDIIINNNTLSDFFDAVSQVEEVEGRLQKSLVEIKALKVQLEERQKELDKKSVELNTLKETLTEKKVKLDQQETAKTYYLLQAGRSEKKFQDLISQAKLEQQKLNSDIVNLEKIIRQRLGSSGEPIQSTGRLIWPVPKNTITAYFYDPEYPFRAIFEHPGVDVRAAQGTAIKAADSGYVAKAKDAGKGYSYIMIIHSDGLSTVYGHVSKIYVQQDSYVSQGDIIGLTGGTPGTAGAGPYVTGPHLHFETRLNGIPTNPLDYLP
ncbi:peptidoglycan DD-metalloendopeptidase family protein [Candidatus Falkowbacteria bacterium]|nr:peptidoglycan DD-metalloendopeptidase family protein [Candidatus Falkowbacteria bacterium]